MINLILKSFQINAPLKIRHKGIIDVVMLSNIIYACQYLDYPHLYRALFLTAYYSFLRISNFAPPAAGQFDTTRHLTRGDIVWGAPGAHLILKWHKAMQKRSQCQVIQLPALKNKNLCPIIALQTYFKLCPASYKSPMLSILLMVSHYSV